MRRSCLVAMVLLAAVLMAASLSLQRCFMPQTTDAAGTPGLESAAGIATVAPLAPTAVALLMLADLDDARVQGLSLEAVRPLMLAEVDVRALDATEDRLYALGADPASGGAVVYEIESTGGSVLRQVGLLEPAHPTAVAIEAAGETLWIALAAADPDEETLLLALDRGTLAERARQVLPVHLNAAARGADGTLYGASADGAWFYHWSADGTLLNRQPNATGARYADCEMVDSSLACTGVMPEGGVLDVLHGGDFSLLARHVGTTRTEQGGWVLGHTWARQGARFLFVPADGAYPMLWAFALDGVSADAYLPSAEQ